MDRDIGFGDARRDTTAGSRLALSQGRSGASETDARPEPFDRKRLAQDIKEAAADGPTLQEFMTRLERRGVRVLPSIQSSGRLNGFSYVLNGNRVRGSQLGRQFTAHGLQKQFGLRYERSAQTSQPNMEARSAVALNRAPESRQRESLHTPGRMYLLSESERATLAEIGRFRTLDEADLAHFRYQDNRSKLNQDLRSLVTQGLVKRHQAFAARGHKMSVTVLTKEGRRLLERSSDRQAVYSGFVKPGEIAHDTAIYRMFQQEAARIQQQGGQLTRVVLDFELKKNIYAALARGPELPTEKYAQRQQQIARDNHLKVVDGKILLPDLRIEYETREGAAERVDLELATGHYHGRQLADKAQAGFKIYAPAGSSARLSAALDERDLIVSILSL